MDTRAQFSLQPTERIALFRALRGIGDFLCIVPTLRALRAAFPVAQIVLVGLEEAVGFAERFPAYLDQVIVHPGFPGLLEKTPEIRRIPAFFAEMQARRFDLALQMHGSGGNTNPVTALLGATRTAGFYLPGQYCPDPEYYLPYIDSESEILRYLRLLDLLGIPNQGSHLEFPLSGADMDEWQTLDARYDLQPGDYICVHAGASTAVRRWSVAGFAQVADRLAAQGFQIVLTGTAPEYELAEQVRSLMHAPALNLAGQTSLGGLAALVNRARMVITNDTGISHIAAALCIPSVVIFTDTDPNRWAPLDRTLHRIASPASSWDLAGRAGDGAFSVDQDTRGIEPAKVLAEAEQLLQAGVQQ